LGANDRSYVGVFGDEVKYFPEEKFTNLLKAVRGFRVKYGMNVWYRSRTLTTDMPNPNHIGEYDWILKLAKQNDKDKILLMLQAGFVYNETKKTYVATLQEYNEVLKKYRFDKSPRTAFNRFVNFSSGKYLTSSPNTPTYERPAPIDGLSKEMNVKLNPV